MSKNTLNRSSILMLIDAMIIVGAYFLTYAAILPRYLWTDSFQIFRYTFLIVMVLYLASYALGGIYKQMWRYADAGEFQLCFFYSLLGGGAFIIVAGIIRYHVPLRIQLLSPFVIAFLIIASRLVYKVAWQKKTLMEGQRLGKVSERDGEDLASGDNNQEILEKVGNKKPSHRRKRLAIVGAGESGALLYKEIRQNPHIRYDVIFFADDNRDKIGRRLYTLPIYGPIDNIKDLSDSRNIDEIIIAMPAVTGERKKRVVELCSEASAEVKILPAMAVTLSTDKGAENRYEGSDALLNKLRKIDVEDLLGREPIRVDDGDISSYIAGKNILVTGGGGSIGSELCRQAVKYKAKKLIILDSYENCAYDIQQELIRDYRFTPQVEILDVKNPHPISELFAREKEANTPIDIVFHAAAHKHVPLMEHNPESAIKNNIFGTLNIAKIANEYGVQKMILISTDKAVNPTNVMGATKRACELVVQSMNQISKGTVFAAVRFGNVLGSNGSVIPLFKKQIENGGPVTVTHPDIIRYFMTIPEAVSLVLNAGGLAQGGEVFVLDMGDPVKIIDLAKNLIKLAGLELGKDIDIVFTGLRPGEKLFEELLMDEEGLKTTKSEKIFIGQALSVDPKDIFTKIDGYDANIRFDRADNQSDFAGPVAAKAWLKGLVVTYRPDEQRPS